MPTACTAAAIWLTAGIKDGTLKRIKGLINVDMIGDKNLNIPQETNGNGLLRKLVWDTAAELGYKAYFIEGQQIGEEDDHFAICPPGSARDRCDRYRLPRLGTRDTDTMDKLSVQSLEIVGTVVHEAVRRLDRQ